MQPIVTDGVVWYVSLSWSWDPQRWLNRMRCHLGCGLRWAQGTMY